jgi:hypothetical protein
MALCGERNGSKEGIGINYKRYTHNKTNLSSSMNSFIE